MGAGRSNLLLAGHRLAKVEDDPLLVVGRSDPARGQIVVQNRSGKVATGKGDTALAPVVAGNSNLLHVGPYFGVRVLARGGLGLDAQFGFGYTWRWRNVSAPDNPPAQKGPRDAVLPIARLDGITCSWISAPQSVTFAFPLPFCACISWTSA